MRTPRSAVVILSPARVRLLVAAGLLAPVLVLYGQSAAQGDEPRERAPMLVGTARVERQNVPTTFAAIGTVQPLVSVMVRSQLAGTLMRVDFKEGQRVVAGMQLAEVDPRPYRIALAAARANLARDLAQLQLARLQEARLQTLGAEDSIARQQVDSAIATAKQFAATVDADRAAVRNAALKLAYTRIVAPVSGQVGLRQVDRGNFVTPGDAQGIVTIAQTQPIDVSFAIPQAQLPAFRAALANGRALPVEALDQDGRTLLDRGRFLTLDNGVDPASGTIKAKARFANSGGRLVPNQFVNVRVVLGVDRAALVVPQQAVRHGSNGDFVFALVPGSRVRRVPVLTGPSSGDHVEIRAGLAPGIRVITDGADALDDGSRVSIDARPRRAS